MQIFFVKICRELILTGKNFCISSHKFALMNYFKLTRNLILRISINIITTSSSKIPRLRATASAGIFFENFQEI
ncbi:hypothetical protein AYB34_09100 [Leptospira sp. ZV016]|nr:hypothetical protein AYB34_09100 [Leptospira sp. ZV016]